MPDASNLRATTDTRAELSTARAARDRQEPDPEASDGEAAGGIGKFVRNTFDGS